ncbi:unnamed protein product [Penicillium salamii]|uniref:chitinase n=1 Tax=Penicillium salamii TaxID=1612424 RepID=A0A9W4JNF5_9EURO|nr:unnamed protein product [Penicillium salamii]CAG8176190.1 unnamed protein product [Penicillium salamii]CAG8362225.1 unnamed protein product [Penicillium salamii]CAG8396281.1 unnamed protein product [Penicillium salamii]CAG8404781.1 unnamed protein product [Penicillium salamii]
MSTVPLQQKGKSLLISISRGIFIPRMLELLGNLQPRRIYLWVCLLAVPLILITLKEVPYFSAVPAVPVHASGEVFFASNAGSSFHKSHGHLHHRSSSHSALHARDDYSCSASNPCSNGACCGAGGYCGYGSTYCGDGCLSNCDAVAECGKDASTKNATCPLSVCCSEYGFCGTSTEFCDKDRGCQSNCVIDPSPPSASKDVAPTNKVIGYYEGWSASSKCHETKVTDLPLGSLTHLNFAFAYLDSNYEIIPMDDLTWSLFDDITAVKDTNPALKIFVSVGGWTFSDNETTTQPLFGEIAADSEKRKTFSENVLMFIKFYGFDGIDIDWEYPGAGDRGGKKRDTENYVALLKELRSVFDKSGYDLGISFTAPSSYWYLRWFDIAGMMKYADWLNFMTYDLHGVWDQDDAIGSIIQGHTNLTEIKTAAELLWRVDTDPSKVVMGFGFYGRTFTLSDSSCTSPGCSFSEGGKAGSCTDQSGYLAYYEVADILQKNPSISPMHDEDAAVLYFSWDDDQWISYDNETTFKQKLDWASEVGIGGSLIWASDQDDYSWTAHKALLGDTNVTKAQAKLVSRSVVSSSSSAKKDATSNGLNQNCEKGSECVDLGNPQVTCGSGYKLVGYDKAKCRKSAKKFGVPICCATKSAPTTCQWRGSGPDCNGQCHKGEVELFGSSTGGGDYQGFKSESGTSKCNRGGKAFCCTDNKFDALTAECYWSNCGSKCLSGETSVATAVSLEGKCSGSKKGQHYCCRDKPVPLSNCHWIGKGDCADNTCNDSEVMLITDNKGGGGSGCNWGRSKALCCTADDSSSPAAACRPTDNPCELDPDSCIDNETGRRMTKRDSSVESDEDEFHSFDKRGTTTLKRTIKGYIGNFKALGWPPSGSIYATKNGAKVLKKTFDFATNSCGSVAIAQWDPKLVADSVEVDTEHVVDKSIVLNIFRTAVGGKLPSGDDLKTAVLDGAQWSKYWGIPVKSLVNAPGIANGNSLIPNDRMYSALGSKSYRDVFLVTEKYLNIAKGGLFNFQADDNGLLKGEIVPPIGVDPFQIALAESIKTGKGELEFLWPLRRAIGVWTYLADEAVLSRVNTVRQNLYSQSVYLSSNVPGYGNLPRILTEFDNDYYRTAAKLTQQWALNKLMLASLSYAGVSVANSAVVAKAIEELTVHANSIEVPDLTTFKEP